MKLPPYPAATGVPQGLREEGASRPWARALNGVGAVVRAELFVHVAHMRPDGVNRHGQLAGDLRRGQVGRQVAQVENL
jgi:hypothetical protein